ncbi:MAG: hypothetical protein D4S01_00615 [Dehalococcoidia bacterium]|nr:MAG: hypothetical protein D4S01_00615 [Dehalococcoidia bacterium]
MTDKKRNVAVLAEAPIQRIRASVNVPYDAMKYARDFILDMYADDIEKSGSFSKWYYNNSREYNKNVEALRQSLVRLASKDADAFYKIIKAPSSTSALPKATFVKEAEAFKKANKDKLNIDIRPFYGKGHLRQVADELGRTYEGDTLSAVLMGHAGGIMGGVDTRDYKEAIKGLTDKATVDTAYIGSCNYGDSGYEKCVQDLSGAFDAPVKAPIGSWLGPRRGIPSTGNVSDALFKGQPTTTLNRVKFKSSMK